MPIGEGKNRWRYAFECRLCANKHTEDGAVYCTPIRSGTDVIHADDDYVLRCDGYVPAQYSLFEEAAE